jgi:hypothetical protein
MTPRRESLLEDGARRGSVGDAPRSPFVALAKLACMSALLGAVFGCQKTGKFGEVTGTVRVDGVPAAGVQVSFEPQTADPRVVLPAAYGMTKEDGTYRLLRRGKESGASIGLNHVRMVPVEREGGKNAVIHPRYQANNALWADVKPGTNVIDFDLLSGKKTPAQAAPEDAPTKK